MKFKLKTLYDEYEVSISYNKKLLSQEWNSCNEGTLPSYNVYEDADMDKMFGFTNYISSKIFINVSGWEKYFNDIIYKGYMYKAKLRIEMEKSLLRTIVHEWAHPIEKELKEMQVDPDEIPQVVAETVIVKFPIEMVKKKIDKWIDSQILKAIKRKQVRDGKHKNKKTLLQ